MNTATLNTNRFWAYLQLTRPANIITAWADVLAGIAASGFLIVGNPLPVAWLILSTTGLYGGGVVFNDVFDADLDAKERPERPIPSGRSSLRGAVVLGGILLSIGVFAAAQVSWLSFCIACGVAAAALLYDAYGKHHTFFGPLNMGICRGGNLLLGVSILSPMLRENWYLALIPITYIAAITAISQGEVHGGKRSTGVVALILMGMVIAGLLGLGLLNKSYFLAVLPFVILLSWRVLLPFVQAVSQPSAENIRTAVRSGVLSLIVLDATVSCSFAGFSYGLLLLSLLPISIMLAKLFSVT
ncbi:4-hydroxybenzoate polyprenyltransferase-like prenyltransferase [Rivularia sp. PCC 7116]|uniref:UbiA-like protein EboC n=1 Tax=Rivularia sp. PCC 7116 TaxID=373994 RepID=UPI00029F0E3F|nr:UbiA-like protein EboC [Rivularia sp. PCC 7116]AFY54433.1 4-hydroxybenzoate polyprenyltransferase-like prenyltransferase [Rivularia sp. PCC 7116]